MGAGVHVEPLGVHAQLRVPGHVVGVGDARELLDLTRSCLLVQALGISLLGLLYGDVNEDFDEWERAVGVGGVGVELSRELAVGLVWGDEGCEGEGGGVGEELGDLE